MILLADSKGIDKAVQMLICCTHMWAAPCINMTSDIGRQRRPKSACASIQSDQGLHCPLTESLNTLNVSIEIKCPDESLRMRRINLNVHFGHA